MGIPVRRKRTKTRGYNIIKQMRMEKSVSLSHPKHNFIKKNLMGIPSSIGIYDEYECTKCTLEGRRYRLDNTLGLPSVSSDKLINECDGSEIQDNFIYQWIRVTRCDEVGGERFANILPNTIHQIVIPPELYLNGDKGVWVMGIGGPVKLLFGEFSFHKKMKRTKFSKK